MSREREEGPEEGKVLHQPPSAEDLRRYPPEGPACARIRGLMRDFVDEELGSAIHAEVEEHVHGCRPCALALARAEHELLQVRLAFRHVAASQRTGPQQTGPSPGFADSVLRRLLEDVGGERLAEAPRVRSAGASFSLFVGLALGSVLLTLLVLVQGWILGGGETAPERLARLVITRSVGAHGLFGDRRRELLPGAGLGDDQLLWVGADGAAQAEWHDASAKSQPAATFEMAGNAALRLRHGEPVLVNGELLVDTRRAVRIALGDGSRLELGIGRYKLTAEDALLGRPWDPQRGAPQDLRVGVEVVHGDGARILRENAPAIDVAAGWIGVYSGGWSEVQPSPSGLGPVARGPNPEPGADPLGSFRGLVWERRGGMAAVGVDVLVSYRNRGQAYSVSVGVEPSGFFTFETGGVDQPPHCEAPFAVVQMLPSAQTSDFGLTAPDAFRVIVEGNTARLLESLICDVSQPLEGVVVNESGEHQLGVRVVPCVIDDLFGTVLPWGNGQVVTDSFGRYRLSRLPAVLPRHQTLALVLFHPDLEATVVPIPARAEAASQRLTGRIAMPGLRSVRVQGLPPNAMVQIFQDVPGLPPGTAARILTAQTDQQGRIEDLLVGRGKLWLRNNNPVYPMLRELVPDGNPFGGGYQPAPGAPVPLAVAFESHQVLPGTSLALAASYRYQDLARTGLDGAEDVFVVDEQFGNGVGAAKVFAVQETGPRQSGRPRFLGFTSPTGALRFVAEPEDQGILAVADDGAMAWLDLQTLRQREGVMGISAPGRVLLGPGARPSATAAEPVVPLRFEPLDSPRGMAPVLRRFATDLENWEVGQLPPGGYRAWIGAAPRMIRVPAGGLTVLE